MPATIPPIGSPTPGTQAPGNPNANLGKDDFLKLFVAQMRHQDPTQPMDNGAMMAQMAQFSTLEQVSNLALANGRVADSLAVSQSISLIGKTVTYNDAAGVAHTGIVEKVSTSNGQSLLTVAGIPNVDPSLIVSVS